MKRNRRARTVTIERKKTGLPDVLSVKNAKGTGER